MMGGILAGLPTGWLLICVGIGLTQVAVGDKVIGPSGYPEVVTGIDGRGNVSLLFEDGSRGAQYRIKDLGRIT